MILGSIWDSLVDSFCRFLCHSLPNRARIVPKSNDPSRPLIIQFKIWGSGRGSSLFLQHFVAPEDPDYFHVHRWEKMRSLVLSDRFIEERPIAGYEQGELRAISHSRLSYYSMDRSVMHHVAYWGPKCWTLFYMSKEKSDQWGWFHKSNLDQMIYWKDFVQRRVPALETRRNCPMTRSFHMCWECVKAAGAVALARFDDTERSFDWSCEVCGKKAEVYGSAETLRGAFTVYVERLREALAKAQG